MQGMPLRLLLLSLPLLLIACAEPGPRLPPLPREGVILAFGDSLTFGSGASGGESYPAVLEQLTGRKVINAGIPGETTAEGLERLPALLDRHRPDLLLLCEGGNDMLRRLDPGEAEANLRRMIGEARRRGVPVLLIAVPRPGLLLSDAGFYARLARESRVPLLADALPRILADEALKSDPVHPNAAGYRKLAEAVRDRLRELGALQ
ncbi:MAG: arylesterase [Gammaproteobacteria bacterium]|nr:MAG: arylesterase [Gammaproteobacteria bacterium]